MDSLNPNKQFTWHSACTSTAGP